MARGIISTILGGLAGGLEGRRLASVREREEAERAQERKDRLERDRAEAQQRQLMNMLAIQQAGGTIGAVLRPDQAAIAQRRLDDTAVSRALDQAPLFERPTEAPLSRSPLEAALQTRMPAPSFSAERRNIPQFTPMREDEDYQQITLPGGQVASFLTPEARERRSLAEEERILSAQDARDEAERERINRMNYRTFTNIYSGAGEYDPQVDYGFALERQSGLERVAASRTPARPEAPEPTPRERFVEWVQEQIQGRYNPDTGTFDAPSREQIADQGARFATAIGLGPGEAVGLMQDMGIMDVEPPPPLGGGTGAVEDLYSPARAISRIERREQRREAAAAEEAGVEARLERDLNAYTRYLITNPNNADVRAAREATYRQLSQINPERYPPIQRSREEEIQRYTGWGG